MKTILNYPLTKAACTVATLLLSSSLMAAPAANEKSALGVNLNGINYWATEWMLLDVMKQASNGSGELWATTKGGVFNTGHQSSLDLDQQGWPKSLPSGENADFDAVTTIVYLDNKHYAKGEYVVLYEGEGQLSYTGVTHLPEKSSPGRDIVRLDDDSVFFLRIDQTDPNNNGNYLRNIRVIVPGGICGNDPLAYAENERACTSGTAFNTFEQVYRHQTFHPLFLKDMAKFRSLRYMHMFNTNGSNQSVWSDRATYDYASWGMVKGVPIELAIDLSNKTQSEPWLNIPARVDDHYMREYAKLVKAQLNSNLNIHIELGNEVWNNAWPYNQDAQWMEAEGQKLWPEEEAHPLTYRLNYFGMRSTQMCEIFKTEFGTEAHRVKCIMGAQGGNAWIGEQSLACPLWASRNNGQNCAANMDAVAIGPYFAGYVAEDSYLPIVTEWAQMGEAGLDKLFEEINGGVLRGLTYDPNEPEWAQAPEGGSLAQARGFIAENKALANRYGLALVAYEGGQHLTFAGNLNGDRAQVNEALFLKGNRDQRMGEAFTQHFNDWKTLGGGMYMVFESTGRWGAYGAFPLKEYQTQAMSETPKLAATLNFIDNNPCWWTGCERVTNAFEQVQIDELPQTAGVANIDVSATPAYDTWGVTLNWQAPNVAVSQYQVFRDGVFVGFTDGQTTTFTNHWLQLHTEYAFEVKGLDANNVVIAQSEIVKSLAGDSVAPTAPDNVVAVANDVNGFDLSWTPSIDASGVAYYVIYRNGAAFTISYETNFSDAWLPTGSVSYQIFAADHVGNLSQGSQVLQLQR